MILSINIFSNFRNSQKGESSGFLSKAVSVKSFNKTIFFVVHSVRGIPSIINYKKDVFVSVIPFNELVGILYHKNMIFSSLENFIFVANVLDVRLKPMLGQQLIELVSVSFGSGILNVLIFIENDDVLFFWMICVFF